MTSEPTSADANEIHDWSSLVADRTYELRSGAARHAAVFLRTLTDDEALFQVDGADLAEPFLRPEWSVFPADPGAAHTVRMPDGEHSYWYNSRTGAVEYGLESPSLVRVGPFATREEAERAPEVLRANSERWAAEDDEAER
ncbi:hypothetical protein ACTJI8_06815 [Microbacterium sp. 22303]|uniref:hypothetical protein n=1 Tax=Microbacterium sp. 22303 TaxID=3453905 RepID=UPI003F87D77D